jgi:phage protein D
MAPNDVDRLAPEFRISVDGADLRAPAAADVLWVSVDEDVDAPAMFRMELINWDPDKLRMKWSDDDLFKEGKQVEIQMGYRDHLESLIKGEITALELSVASHDLTTLVVHGFDRSHRLQRGRKTRAFTNVTDSDIARRVAEAMGFTVDAEQTQERFDYILQCNQTDLEFLRGRARSIGFEVIVREKTLVFRSRAIARSAAATLALDRDLLAFRPRLTTVGQAPATVVRGWNPAQKTAFVGQAGPDDAPAKMGGTILGAASVKDRFGEAIAAAIDQPVASQAEADQYARARFNETALAYISGDGVCVGRTDLRAGVVISVEGVGDRFSGNYYVTSAIHSYVPKDGYRTRFSFRRNAS